MTNPRQRAYSICFLALLILTVSALFIARPIFPNPWIPNGFLATSSPYPRCSPNFLGSNPQTVTYDRGGMPEDHTSLIGRARSILNESAGNEFVRLREKGANAKRYGVSMFHQLHCLELLRYALYGDTAAHSHTMKKEEDRKEHVDHCFQYLAQGILCAADDTIEPSLVSETPQGMKVLVVNGHGVVHQCREFGAGYRAVVHSQTEPIVVARNLTAGDSLRGILNHGG